jgi:signal transduction histidine kinase
LISQVFSNILENAVKYSSTLTEIQIYGHYNADNDTVSVFIANKGIPLLPDDAKFLFKRGYRSKDARNTYPAGTGFGLYIAQKIVDIHEGSINASTDNKGFTIFQVTLSVKGLQGKAVQLEAKDSIDRRR